MSSIEDIATAKIQASVQRNLDGLTPTITQIKGEMNRRGVLHSSMTVTEIHKACITLFDDIQSGMWAECKVVLDGALWPTPALVSRLILKANEQFDLVVKRTQSEVAHAATGLLNDSIYGQLSKDLLVARDRALVDLSLAVEGHQSVKKNRRIREAIAFVPSMLAKFLKGGAK